MVIAGGYPPPGLDHDDDPWHSWLTLRYTNFSGGQIEALAFAVSYSDILSPEPSGERSYADERALKPGKRAVGVWANGVDTQNLSKQIHVRIRLTKAVFSDGDVWQKSSPECYWEFVTK
jgi:hypothetical protein